MRVLGIETSCDETCASVYDEVNGVLSNRVQGQSFFHRKFGGIVPEISSRLHAHSITSVVQSALDEGRTNVRDLNGIAYTAGPGLSGSLLVGAVFGKSLSYSAKIPSVPVNHLEGHILSIFLKNPRPIFPFLVLLVSGKHTQLIWAKETNKYILLGQSHDDAVGEVFDKVARSLNLECFEGSCLSEFAEQGKTNFYTLPKPMAKQPDLNFSFSGLKTHTIRLIKEIRGNKHRQHHIARAFEDTIIEILREKCERALDVVSCNSLAVVGGVSANKKLRRILKRTMEERNGKLFCMNPVFCTDNAAMIAYAGIEKLKRTESFDLSIRIDPKWN